MIARDRRRGCHNLSTTEKLLEKLSKSKEEAWPTIEALLTKQGFIRDGSCRNGSHFTYIHPKLLELVRAIPKDSEISQRYAPNGQIIIIVHKNKVPGYVLRKLAQAIADIDDYIKYFENRE